MIIAHVLGAELAEAGVDAAHEHGNGRIRQLASLRRAVDLVSPRSSMAA